jgi:hypothetical protein
MPFDVQQFLDVFGGYNAEVFPAQVVLLVAALLALRLAANGDSSSSKAASSILVLLWLWAGVVYHWIFFSAINTAAIAFGSLFVLQALVFFYAGVVRNEMSFSGQSGLTSAIGTSFVIYAVIVYPLIGMASGHAYPYAPTFGVPCPTTIFTLGLLLRSGRRVPLYVLPIPLAWSLIGGSAAYLLGMWEDLGLLVAGFIGAWLLVSDHFSREPRDRSASMVLKEN